MLHCAAAAESSARDNNSYLFKITVSRPGDQASTNQQLVRIINTNYRNFNQSAIG
jgi:hypothetical protein